MRISTSQFFQRSSQSMGSTQTQLLEAQQRLSSGEQRIRPSDAPGNAQASLRLAARLDRLDRFASNQDAAEATLSAEETALAGLSTNLQRVKELAILLGNGALTEDDALGIEAELRALKEEAVSLANRPSPTGEALFGGTGDSARAFNLEADGSVAYEGTAFSRSLPIGEGRSVALGGSGQELFQAIAPLGPVFLSVGAGNTGDAVFAAPELTDAATFEAANTPLSVTFNGNGTVDVTDSPVAPAIPTTTTIPITDQTFTIEGVAVSFKGTPAAGDTLTLAPSESGDLFAVYDAVLAAAQAPRSTASEQAAFQNQLQGAQDGLAAAEAQLGRARSSVGARLAAVDGERDLVAETRLAVESQRSALDDLDYTEAITAFQQQLTALQAAQSAFSRLSDLSLFNFLR
jgi:flagellar hook-associated protein 3 FlgL